MSLPPHNSCTGGPPMRGADRLLVMMENWWAGWSLEQQAAAFGVCRTRVRYLLTRVGCEERLRSQQRRVGELTSRPAPQGRSTWAFEVLSEYRSCRMPPKQRGALAWTALGLSTVQAGWRLGVSPQRVSQLLRAAQPVIELDWGDMQIGWSGDGGGSSVSGSAET